MSTTPPPSSPYSLPAGAPQGPPGNSQPPPPEYAHGWMPASHPPRPRNGFGVTALVLGNIGALLSFIPFTFWLGAPLGVLALVFGLIGVSQARKGVADNKGSAVAGSILGGVAIVVAAGWLFIGIAAFSNATYESGGITESTAPASPGDGYETSGPLQFGQPHTYDDGVTITVSEPKKFIPDKFAAGHTQGNAAVQVKITLFNGSDKAINVDTALAGMTDTEGVDADVILSGKMATDPFSGKLLPGKTVTPTFSFSVPSDAVDKVEVEASPTLTNYDDVIWAGPAK